jgi:hypothetical protein
VNYPFPMANSESFDLPAFMLSHFSRVDFGGDLFNQWPVGIRFEIGTEKVSRAAKLYEFALAKADDCVLVSQDWTVGEEIVSRSTPLFATSGILASESGKRESVDVLPFDEISYRLTWTRLSPLAVNAPRMFQAIANRERGGMPKVSSGVYVIDPRSKIIMHMYDDRGLDIIAVELNTIRPLFESFGHWILENQRHKIAFRFRTTPAERPCNLLDPTARKTGFDQLRPRTCRQPDFPENPV